MLEVKIIFCLDIKHFLVWLTTTPILQSTSSFLTATVISASLCNDLVGEFSEHQGKAAMDLGSGQVRSRRPRFFILSLSRVELSIKRHQTCVVHQYCSFG